MAASALDLRRAPLARPLHGRLPQRARDFWADEIALRDRLVASWAGLDDAAWRLPGAAPSDAGGPDWSLLDHAGHLVDWLRDRGRLHGGALATGEWPSDDDYDGGDFDRFNEARRAVASVAPGRPAPPLRGCPRRLLPMARRLDPRDPGDAAWGWVYNVLHGHDLDHLRVIEPWADTLRARQAQNDPFGGHPEPLPSDLAAGKAAFWSEEAAVTDLFRDTVLSLPDAAWTAAEVTPGWTVADHVGHLAAWFDETARVIGGHSAAKWPLLPSDGIDAWNEADVARRRGTPPDVLREPFETSRSRLVDVVRTMADDSGSTPKGLAGPTRTSMATSARTSR